MLYEAKNSISLPIFSGNPQLNDQVRQFELHPIEDIDIDSDTKIRSEIRVSDYMKVSLIDPSSSNIFSIRSTSEEIQFIDEDAATEWKFYVTPLLTGQHTLELKVVIMEIINGIERVREKTLEENVVIVTEKIAEKIDNKLQSSGLSFRIAQSHRYDYPTKFSHLSKGLRTLSLVLASVVAFAFFAWALSPELQWLRTNNFLKSKQAYKDFINDYPKSRHIDDAFFNLANLENSKDQFIQYLNLYPQGKYREEAMWKVAELSKAAYYYRMFIKSFPNSKKSLLAKKKLKSLELKSIHSPNDIENPTEFNTKLINQGENLKEKQVLQKNNFNQVEHNTKKTSDFSSKEPVNLSNSKNSDSTRINSSTSKDENSDQKHEVEWRKIGDLWALFDSTNTQITLPKYKSVENFIESYARVKLDSVWIMVNRKGKEFFSPRYEDVSDFGKSFAFVKKGDRWGVINNQGMEIVAPQYKSIDFFSNELFIVSNEEKRYGIIDTSGQVILPLSLDGIYPMKKGYAKVINKYNNEEKKWGLVDSLGKLLITPKYDSIEYVGYGLILAKTAKRYGLINMYDEKIIDFQLKQIKPFQYKNTWAQYKNNKWGVIDFKGNKISDSIYSNPQYYISGVAWAERKGKSVMLNELGKEIIETWKRSNVKEFKNGLAWFYSEGTWGVINYEGDTIVSPKYNQFGPINGQITKVRKSDYWGLIDSSGRELIKCKYDYLFPFKDSILIGKINGSWNFITYHDVLIRDTPYSKIENALKYGKILVSINDKKGLIDSSGIEILPAIYDDIKYSDKVIFGKKSGSWILLDSLKNETKNKFKYVSEPNQYNFWGVKDKKWECYNLNGEKANDLIVDKVSILSPNGSRWVQRNEKWALINPEGNLILSTDYTKALGFNNGFAVIQKENRYWGVINRLGVS